jgi:tetratricopeptide (TPR) repeat protein
MKYSGLLILLSALIFSGCTSENNPEQSPKDEKAYQAISAMGDTLYAPPLGEKVQAKYQSNLDSAEAAYQSGPNNADAIIWYGRRTAYMGDYREAIDLYTEGIKKHPKDARFYRHRGHRYITTRQFDKAVSDLKKAASLIEGSEDQVEPDGLPNEQNDPRSTLHTNIWYHLGLAQYLTGDFEETASSFQNCLDASTNDDMKVAATYWLYMSLRRAGMDLQAGKTLEPIEKNMDIIENESYHKLLMVFKGTFEEKTLLNDTETPLDNATIGYGLGNWHYINGREGRAKDLFQKVYDGKHWNAFGYIAAETDLERLSFES